MAVAMSIRSENVSPAWEIRRGNSLHGWLEVCVSTITHANNIHTTYTV